LILSKEGCGESEGLREIGGEMRRVVEDEGEKGI
jgi:hypothetical protein